MTGYCNWCDSLVENEDMIRTYDDEYRLKWIGCFPCLNKKIRADIEK